MFNTLKKIVVFLLLGAVGFLGFTSKVFSEPISSDLLDTIKQNSVSIYYQSSKSFGSYFEDSPKRQFLTYGSGVVIRTDSSGSYILTNYHVVANGFKFRIKDSFGSYFKGSKIVFDKVKDLALLKVTDSKIGKETKFSQADRLSIGDRLYSIGNPKGYSGSFYQGYVSYLGRSTRDFKNLIQLDMNLEEGSSGSGVFNSEGELVGLIVGIDGRISFAINSEDIQRFLRQSEERLR